MIDHVAGWQQVPGVDSHRLIHPQGPRVAVIAYQERVRPLAKLGALVERWAPGLAPSPPEVIATAEGEYAAVVSGVRGSVRRDLGFVFGDDFYALVDATCFAETEHARVAGIVRQLVAHDQHVLGVRRRRYLYTPPRRWHGLARNFQTDWYPLDYPANPTTISVLPATPTELPAEALVEARLRGDIARGFRVDKVEGPTEVDHALPGVGYRVIGAVPAGRVFLRRFVVLRDARHAYPLLLETAAVEHASIERVFDELCASVQPLPHATTPSTSSSALAHWLG